MFGKGEIPVIVFGILFAMLFIFGAASSPPTGIYSEHRNYTDTLQRVEEIGDRSPWVAMAASRCRQWMRWRS